MYKQIPIITLICHRLIIIYIYQQHIPDNGIKYEENAYSHHGGMNEDRMDGLVYYPIPLLAISI